MISAEILAELEALRSSFQASAAEMVDDIEAGWSQAACDPSGEHVRDLTRKVHSLAGTAGSFALAGLSARARDLEDFLGRLASSGQATPESLEIGAPLLRALRAESRHASS